VTHTHDSRPLAIITGASSGIGRATAIALARRRCETVLIARRWWLLHELARDLSACAPSRAFPFDLARTRDIAPAFAQLLREHSAARPIVLINSAGFGVYGPFLSQSLDDFESLTRLNHLALVETCRAVLPRMLSDAQGHIFNICSMSSVVGTWGHAGYGASKAAMRNLTECLAAEFKPLGVRCTAVLPGIINTPYFTRPTMAPLWQLVKHRAIAASRVADAVASALWTDRLEIHIPAHYRALEYVAAMSTPAAVRLVRRSLRTRPGARTLPDADVPARPLGVHPGRDAAVRTR
jgi:uncharacterized protein